MSPVLVVAAAHLGLIKVKTEPEFASPPLSLFFHGSACWGPDFYSDKNAC